MARLAETVALMRLHSSVEQVPLKRPGPLDDMAYGVLSLACDEAAFRTGAALLIDAGKTAQ
jgi:NAD(P)-dependent dehydrogenase (short-subunit alcohol dehydrogenase family)